MTTFTCKVCGRKTTDITRPCPHWWGLILSRGPVGHTPLRLGGHGFSALDPLGRGSDRR